MSSIRTESELKALAELAIECFERWAVIHKLREVPPSKDVVVIDDEAAIRTEKLYALLGGDDGEVSIEYPWDMAEVLAHDLKTLRGIMQRVREVACINPPAISVPYVEVVLKDGRQHISRANPTCKRWRIASEDGFKVLQDYKSLLDDLVSHIRCEPWGRDFAKGKPEPCVKLMGQDKPPIINGKSMPKKIQSKKVYLMLEAMIEAFHQNPKQGLTKGQIELYGDAKSLWTTIKTYEERYPEWKGVIIRPGKSHSGGYRLAPAKNTHT